MSTKNKERNKSDSVKFLESLSGGPLTFGETLQAIREGDEISQTDFAEKIGLSKSHLCDLEKGRKSISPERAARFAKILGYSPETFVALALQAQVDEAHLKLKVKVEAA